MTLLKQTAVAALVAMAASCASYNAFEQGRNAERIKNWDEAVIQYEKALEIDPDNMRYQINLQRARLEASRIHFEKGKTLRDAALNAKGPTEQLRLAQLAATELELTVKLDPTNQFAAVELAKSVAMINDVTKRNQPPSIDELKKRADELKSQPP